MKRRGRARIWYAVAQRGGPKLNPASTAFSLERPPEEPDSLLRLGEGAPMRDTYVEPA